MSECKHVWAAVVHGGKLEGLECIMCPEERSWASIVASIADYDARYEQLVSAQERIAALEAERDTARAWAAAWKAAAKSWREWDILVAQGAIDELKEQVDPALALLDTLQVPAATASNGDLEDSRDYSLAERIGVLQEMRQTDNAKAQQRIRALEAQLAAAQAENARMAPVVATARLVYRNQQDRANVLTRQQDLEWRENKAWTIGVLLGAVEAMDTSSAPSPAQQQPDPIDALRTRAATALTRATDSEFAQQQQPDAREAECQECHGYGWYARPDKRGKPMQQQCEACHGTGRIALGHAAQGGDHAEQ